MDLGKRLPHAGNMVQDKANAAPPHQFKGLNPAAGLFFGQSQKRNGGVGTVQRDHRRGPAGQDRKEFEAGGRDDAQGPFSTDQQLLEVIARIVLAKPLEPVPDLTIGQDRLKAQDQIAHRTIAQHRRAARIGRDQPANGCRAFGRQAKREMSTLGGRGLMDSGQGDARLNHDHIVKGLDLTDRLHPLERQQHLAVGDLSPDQSGVAALRGDGHARLGAKGHDLRDLLRCARQKQERRIAMPAPAPLDQLGGQSFRVLTPAPFADNGLQAGKDGLWNGLAHRSSLAAGLARGQRVLD